MQVKVDHKALSKQASDIKGEVDEILKEINNIKEAQGEVKISWKGRDADEYFKVANMLVLSNEEYDGFTFLVNGLKNHQTFLEFAAEEYKELQTRAIREARKF